MTDTATFDLAAFLDDKGFPVAGRTGMRVGQFLPAAAGFRTFADLDGAEAARFLVRCGVEDVEHHDTGSNGLAFGKLAGVEYALSTNGYLSRDAQGN